MPRGRHRDRDAEERILAATFELLSSAGRHEVRIDDIAAAAGVGKQTIYRWWPSRDAVAIDALLWGTLHATPFPDTGDAERDLRTHLRRVAKLFASPTGVLIKNTVGDAQHNDDTGAAMRDGFWEPRRALSRACVQRGIERGQIKPDIDIELVLDALYGPMWVRLLFGHERITRTVADHSVDLIWPQIATSDKAAPD